MLKDQMWFRFEEAMHIAYRQFQDEGKEVKADAGLVEEITKMPFGDVRKREMAQKLWEKWEKLPVNAEVSGQEPNGLEEICRLRPKYDLPEQVEDMGISYDRVYGAWLGRCAGCLLGQPMEGWKRERIEGLLGKTGNLPVKGYVSSDLSVEIRKRYGVEDDRKVYGGSKINWINNTDGMPEDDDINYTILALKLMEEKGFEFTSYDVGLCWLGSLPILHVCTAERVAYLNMINGLCPPESAKAQNAYREYIGAQIRADFFGYVCPGNPQKAGELAYRDAVVSHRKNGIYGEMFVAAMVAAAAAENDLKKVITTGLSQIPANCRLAKRIWEVIRWHQERVDALSALDRIHKQYDEDFGYDWCHVIPNAMIVCIGLLYGDKDFSKTMDLCLRAAFDTDCNCATAGSVLGMMLGAEKLPAEWTGPLKDKVRSGVDGIGQARISELAQRTLRVYETWKGETVTY